MSVDESMNAKSFLNKSFLFILIMQIAHAIFNLFVGVSLENMHFTQVLFWVYVMTGILAIPFVYIAKPRLSYSSKALVPFLAACLLQSTGAVALFRAFQDNLAISSTIGLMASPIVFVIAVVLSTLKPELLEHHTRKVYAIRAVGVILILIGVVKLSLS